MALAQRAWAGWQRLERETGESLLLPTGVLNLGPATAPFMRQVVASARDHALPQEQLDGLGVAQRWPGWRGGRGALSETHVGAFESRAGVLRVERILACWRQRLARQSGVALATGARVVALKALPAGGYLARCADGRCFGAQRVLAACGQHLAGLLQPLGVALPLTRVRKTFAWYAADARYHRERFPGFSLTDDALGIYYGFPDIDNAGFKIGRHDAGQPLAPGEPLLAFGEHPDDIPELAQVIARYLPGVGALRHGAVCQYIRTPDEHFLIDEPLPGLVIAGGFSGHGFKFASVMGEVLGEWLSRGTRAPELSSFGLARFSIPSEENA